MTPKTYAIGILSLTATILCTALLVAPTGAAPIGTVIRDRDYTIVTATVQSGGDGLFVMDHKRGMVAVLTYNTSSRTLQLRAVEPVSNVFASALPAGAAPGGAGAVRPK